MEGTGSSISEPCDLQSPQLGHIPTQSGGDSPSPDQLQYPEYGLTGGVIVREESGEAGTIPQHIIHQPAGGDELTPTDGTDSGESLHDECEDRVRGGWSGSEPSEHSCEQHNGAFTGDQPREEDRTSIGSTTSDPDGTYREFSEANTLKIRRDDPLPLHQSPFSSPNFPVTNQKCDRTLESRDIEVIVRGGDPVLVADMTSGTAASTQHTAQIPQLTRPIRRRRLPSIKASGPKTRRKLFIVMVVILVVVILIVITVVLLVVLRKKEGGAGSE